MEWKIHSGCEMFQCVRMKGMVILENVSNRKERKLSPGVIHSVRLNLPKTVLSAGRESFLPLDPF